MDPLIDVGMAHSAKMSYWEVYVFFNAVGCIFCAILMTAVYRLKDTRTSNDILAAALCLSCFVMSLSCGMQCLLNTINGHFAYGEDACYTEAFFHLISITTMFFILALMAYNSYRTIVQGESLPNKHAVWFIVGIWILCGLGVGLFSLGSPIYMSPSGVFCFFTFDSMLMYAFFAPSFLITFGAMVFLSYRIFTITRATLKQMGTHLSTSQTRKELQMRLAQKLFLFVVVFLTGWCALVAGVILQLILGQIYELDAIGGVLGVIHSLAVPITYSTINPRIRHEITSWVMKGPGDTTDNSEKSGEKEKSSMTVSGLEQSRTIGAHKSGLKSNHSIAGGTTVTLTTLTVDDSSPTSSIHPPSSSSNLPKVARGSRTSVNEPRGSLSPMTATFIPYPMAVRPTTTTATVTPPPSSGTKSDASTMAHDLKEDVQSIQSPSAAVELLAIAIHVPEDMNSSESSSA